MDTFQHSYYSLNRHFLLLIGQWPYQNPTNRFCRMLFFSIIMSSFTIPQISLFITNASFYNILEIVPPLTAVLTISTKFWSLYIYRNNLKELLEQILENWTLWKSKEEIDIMHEFSKEGKMLTVIYTIYIYASMTMFLVSPMTPRIMDLFVPLNESRHVNPIFKSEYFIDEDQYFLSIYFHMCITVVIGITVLVTADALFLVFNSHICGVFTVVGSQLEHFFNGQVQSQKPCLESIIYAIKNHKRALEFAKLIESFYCIPLFLQISSSLICMAVSLFQVLITLEKPSVAFKYVAFAIAQLAHLFCLCYPSQRMIDYSTQIQFKAYSGLWYEAPIEVHKLVLLIIQRSLVPCCLTAGKIFPLCLESFSTILQTSISYFMVIAGVQ